MTDEQLFSIGDKMHPEFLIGFSRTYMFCIAREGARGVHVMGLDKSAAEEDIYFAAKKSISTYFNAWSDDLNKELAKSFAKHYKSV